MTTINDIILAEAKKQIGTWEWAGDDHNPAVLAMYADAGHPGIRNDEVPWCAAYVGAVLARVGLRTTGSLMAKSYLKWGTEIPSLGEALPGDLVIFDRGSHSWQGHVGFLIGYGDETISVLGGNQHNQVNIRNYPRKKLVGIRRASRPKQSVTESTTLQATGVGGTAAVATGATAIGALDGTAQIVAIVGLFIILAAFAWIFRERLKKFAAGVR